METLNECEGRKQPGEFDWDYHAGEVNILFNCRCDGCKKHKPKWAWDSYDKKHRKANNYDKTSI